MTYVFRKRLSGLVLAAGLGALIVGCDSGTEGQYEASGKVTYNGQPVAKGFIYLIPDSSQGNQGPGGGAPIENGEYRTADGKGIVGGPYIVEIEGYDGVASASEDGEPLPDGKPLFSKYRTTVDFPKEDVEQDFDIPVTDEFPQ